MWLRTRRVREWNPGRCSVLRPRSLSSPEQGLYLRDRSLGGDSENTIALPREFISDQRICHRHTNENRRGDCHSSHSIGLRLCTMGSPSGGPACHIRPLLRQRRMQMSIRSATTDWSTNLFSQHGSARFYSKSLTHV